MFASILGVLGQLPFRGEEKSGEERRRGDEEEDRSLQTAKMASSVNDLCYPRSLLLTVRLACSSTHGNASLPTSLRTEPLKHLPDALPPKTSTANADVKGEGVILGDANTNDGDSESSGTLYPRSLLLIVRLACSSSDSGPNACLPKLLSLKLPNDGPHASGPDTSTPAADAVPLECLNDVSDDWGPETSITAADAAVLAVSDDWGPETSITAADAAVVASLSPVVDSQVELPQAAQAECQAEDVALGKATQSDQVSDNPCSGVGPPGFESMLPCAFASCHWIGSDAEYSMHIEQCPCRPVACPHSGCNWRGPFSDLILHESQCVPYTSAVNAARSVDDGFDHVSQRVARTNQHPEASRLRGVEAKRDLGPSRASSDMWRNSRARERPSQAPSQAQQVRRSRRDFRQVPVPVAGSKDPKMMRVECGPSYRLVPIPVPAAPDDATPSVTSHVAPLLCYGNGRADMQPAIPDDIALEWAMAASVDKANDDFACKGDTCAICLEYLHLGSSNNACLPCKHVFHFVCLAAMQLAPKPGDCNDALCAICRAPFTLAAMRISNAEPAFPVTEQVKPSVSPVTELANASASPVIELVSRSASPSAEEWLNQGEDSDAGSRTNHFQTCKAQVESVLLQSKGAHVDPDPEPNAPIPQTDVESKFREDPCLDDERLLARLEERLDKESGADALNMQTFGTSAGWSFEEAVAANAELANTKAREVRPKEKEGADHIPSSAPDARGNSKWRARRHRVKLTQDIFCACDREDNGRLRSAEMCTFASLSGFNGSAADWTQEYRMLCGDRGCKPEEGFDCKTFTALIDENSDVGCYCTDEELQTIHAKLIKVCPLPMEQLQ